MSHPDNSLGSPVTQELDVSPDRLQLELQRLRLYSARMDQDGIKSWILNSLACDRFNSPDTTDLTRTPDTGIDKPQNSPKTLRYIFNELVKNCHPRFSHSSPDTTTLSLLQNWLQEIFIATGKIDNYQSRSKPDRPFSPFSPMQAYANFLGLPNETKTWLHFNPQFIAQEKFVNSSEQNDLSHQYHKSQEQYFAALALASITYSILVGYRYPINKLEVGDFINFSVLRRINDQSITTISFTPRPTLLTWHDRSSGLSYPYFPYMNDAYEIAFAPGFNGPERFTPPDQLAHTLADFYLSEA